MAVFGRRKGRELYEVDVWTCLESFGKGVCVHEASRRKQLFGGNNECE